MKLDAPAASLDPSASEALALISFVRDYAIYTLDADGRVTSWNAAARAMKGYEAHEIVGQSIARFYTPEDLVQSKPGKLLETALAEGRGEDEGWRVRKDGSRFWASVLVTPIRDSSGRLQGFGKITRDLSERKAAETALREREAVITATLYSIGDAVIATDELARITRVNPVAAKLTGWSEIEGLGRPIDEVFRIVNEETHAQVEDPVRRVLREGIVVGLANHTSLISRDGSERPIADSGAPIRDDAGRTRGVVLVFRDVTAERAMERSLEEREERLRALIDGVRDYAITMIDTEGRLTYWNAGAERMKGYRAQEVLGRHYSLFYTEEDRAGGKPDDVLRMATDQGRVEDEGWRLRKDGSKFLAHVVTSAIYDEKGQLRGFAKVTRDVTERRRMEEESREHRSRAIAAQLALKERDAFISVAAHELRTPLTALQLKLQGLEGFLAEGSVKPGAAGGASSRLDAAVKQTRRLGELVERLLDVSRIVSGRLEMTLEEVDLSELARQVVDEFREHALENGSEIHLAATERASGWWDRLRLQQVVTNLISNAVKYGQGKPIDLSVEDLGDHVRLMVSDQGIGISPDSIERIFERFERAVPGHHFGGLGLGLYVARYIVEAHGGTVNATSTTGQGTTFVVELPKRVPEKHEEMVGSPTDPTG
jgi:PAS domain S-box-containing protein